MLKKQTVWLLTMLSLMIVLSVYYIISPNNDDLAYIDNGQTDTEQPATTDQQEAEDTAGNAEVNEMTNVGNSDELFTSIRMELQDDRSMEIERLEDIVASSNASVEEKDKALQDIDVLEGLSTKESILEQSILQTAEYEDVLVRSAEDKVHVHVKAGELLTNTEVVNIMQMVRDEYGEITVDVNFEPTEQQDDGSEEDGEKGEGEGSE
ncbi:SpoIIIAH-like family protein [Oceanobacillus piezotolerans]|uniref:SpoIIIAH-like family protein n=1 Tax=Oceanobacillus piezotolerans TaxID=2448030 RepID=A0A498D9V5_9BACI|nr:SpoIIIAH-like family protein [Oceanobacillus piezotolerans]RLL48113.1 SpoIIIAH-like family protein [Oceanobacillus piezotolerans]